MNHQKLLPAITMILGTALLISSFAGSQSKTSEEGEAPGQEKDRTAWYPEAKFGMFIHWGPYSLASVEASWPIMVPRSQLEKYNLAPRIIPLQEYLALPRRFNPTQYDPRAWVRLAKAAGQRYMVFTSKHHDGFCMFDSAYTDYKIANTPYGKDIVAMLAEACREENMPLGFYYSPPDMHHPGFRDTSKPPSENWHGEPTRWQWATYLDYMEAQLRELLTKYGDVAIIWFDGLRNQEKYDGLRFRQLVRDLQPRCLINNRIGLPGDYATPEQFIPDRIPTKSSAIRLAGTTAPERPTEPLEVPVPEDFRLWETCMTINRTWAYNRYDQNFKSTTQLIRALVEVASKGGNLLLNVGPTPEGTIQPEFEERLRAIGEWLQVNGEAIYGTTYGPLQNVPFGKTTAKGNTIYLHVFDWPQGNQLTLQRLKGQVSRVTLLKGGTTLNFQQSGDRLAIRIPDEAPDPHVSVLVLKVE